MRDHRPVLSLRPLTTCLLLVTLLLSNVAGWVHVGCCDASPDSSVASEQSEATTASCCCHSHCHSRQPTDTTPPGESSTTPQDSVPHDSDSCHVCQNLFAFRHAILTTSPTMVWEPLAIPSERPELDEVSFEPIFLSGLSGRGPPSV
ncbi:hypothetical protein [Rubripirellula amarantea]|nr:hypothetical protein [Rubripirellula amarantea]